MGCAPPSNQESLKRERVLEGALPPLMRLRQQRKSRRAFEGEGDSEAAEGLIEAAGAERQSAPRLFGALLSRHAPSGILWKRESTSVRSVTAQGQTISDDGV
jgi:hypothetical protein